MLGPLPEPARGCAGAACLLGSDGGVWSEVRAEPKGFTATEVLGCTPVAPPTGCWGRLSEEGCAESRGVWLPASTVPAMRPTLPMALLRVALSGYWVSVPVGRAPGELASACELRQSHALQHPDSLLLQSSSRMNSQWSCQRQHMLRCTLLADCREREGPTWPLCTSEGSAASSPSASVAAVLALLARLACTCGPVPGAWLACSAAWSP